MLDLKSNQRLKYIIEKKVDRESLNRKNNWHASNVAKWKNIIKRVFTKYKNKIIIVQVIKKLETRKN